MELNEEYRDPELQEQSKETTTTANAYEVKDDDNIEESDLRRTFLFGKGDEEKSGNEPEMESRGAGGDRFGESSTTPSGDDPNNPSQNAGYSNEYFRRTEPSDEHPEFQNFKDPNQLGQSNYAQSGEAANTGQSDVENTGPTKDDGSDSAASEENKQEQNTSYQQSTSDAQESDNDGTSEDANVAGYNELPDQQKVGE